VTPNNFTTQPFLKRDQFEAWRRWYAAVFDVLPKHPIDNGFPAEIHLWRLNGMAITRTAAPSVHVRRDSGHIKRDPVDHWVISYCARAAHSAKTADTEVRVPAKVPYLWSLGQEFSHDRTNADRLQLFMPRDAFPDIAPLLDVACGSVLDTPLGHLLGDYMVALERCLPTVTETDFPRITNAVGAMVAAAVAPPERSVAAAKRQIDLGRKERVRQAIRRHLRTPTLGPKNLSRLVGMSRSSLYRLFEDSGGVSQYIRRARLLEARAVLSNPATTLSISAIAEDLCFADSSSFSRIFKREFGCSPSEIRSAALERPALCPSPRNGALSVGATFGELLREL
jgi:AraC-like DNA-binding protein